VSRRLSTGRFSKRATKLFNEGASRGQVGEAPAKIGLVLPWCGAAMVRLNAPRLVELHDPATERDIQSLATHDKLDDVSVLSLVRQRFTDPIPLAHVRRHGTARLGAAKLGAAKLGAAKLGAAKLGAARLGAARLGAGSSVLEAGIA